MNDRLEEIKACFNKNPRLPLSPKQVNWLISALESARTEMKSVRECNRRMLDMIVEIEVDRDRWKARAEELEMVFSPQLQHGRSSLRDCVRGCYCDVCAYLRHREKPHAALENKKCASPSLSRS